MPINHELREQTAAEVQTRAISPVLLETSRSLSPLSDVELVDALLRFANTGGGIAHSLVESGSWWISPGALEQQDGTGIYARDWIPSRAVEQRDLQEALAHIAAGTVDASVLTTWRRRAAGLVLLPTFESDGSRRYQHIAFERFRRGIQPAFAYALLALLSSPFRGRLCRCRWEQCRRFFLQPTDRRGPPIREYCPDTDHRKEAHDAGAAARMRKSRDRAKQPKRRKR